MNSSILRKCGTAGKLVVTFSFFQRFHCSNPFLIMKNFFFSKSEKYVFKISTK